MKKSELPLDFNWADYVNLNKDLKDLGFDEKRAVEHWKRFGHNENRTYKYGDQSKITENIYDNYISVQKIDKFVVYTCISDEYDELREVLFPEKNVDYVCFTNSNIISNTWEIRKLPLFLNELDGIKKSRCIKIMPHLFLKEYEKSLWIDGNIQVVGKITQFVLDKLEHCDFYIPKHPERICIYSEGEAAKYGKKDSGEIVDDQLNKYRKEGYPKNFGLSQTGILLRNHHNCINISKQWWDEVLNHSKRDQLSFNYICWKNKDVKIGVLNPSIISSEFFQYWNHGKNQKNPISFSKNYGAMKNYINGVPV